MDKTDVYTILIVVWTAFICYQVVSFISKMTKLMLRRMDELSEEIKQHITDGK